MQAQVNVNRRLDRRANARPSVKVICRKGTLDLGANIAVAVLDVSETGVRLIVKEPLKVDQEVTVALEPSHGRGAERRVARVAWCVESSEQKYVVGARFDKRLPYADWQKLV
jgi:hypothetical protein